MHLTTDILDLEQMELQQSLCGNAIRSMCFWKRLRTWEVVEQGAMTLVLVADMLIVN
jgi:hypothetical protein